MKSTNNGHSARAGERGPADLPRGTAGTNRRVRVGLLGCSDIARRKFLPALCTSNVAELVAVASRDGGAGQGCAVLGYDGLLSSQDVELIYLSLPNHLHEEWSIRALERGKDVICEKPLALSAASAERMLAAAEANGRLLYENIMYLHHPQHAAVRGLIAEGTIGRVTTLRTVFAIPLPQQGNFRLDPARGGGAFHDLVRYPLSAALYFLQAPPADFRGFSLERSGLTLAVHGLARTAADETFVFTVAFGQQYESYYELIGEEGKIRVDRAFTTPAELANRIMVLRGGDDASFTHPPADHFGLMLDHVCALVRGEGDFRTEHDRTRKIARLADEIEKGCPCEQ